MVASVVRRLLLNFITRPRIPFNDSSYSIFSEESGPGVLQKVGSAAGMCFHLSLYVASKEYFSVLFSFVTI